MFLVTLRRERHPSLRLEKWEKSYSTKYQHQKSLTFPNIWAITKIPLPYFPTNSYIILPHSLSLFPQPITINCFSNHGGGELHTCHIVPTALIASAQLIFRAESHPWGWLWRSSSLSKGEHYPRAMQEPSVFRLRSFHGRCRRKHGYGPLHPGMQFPTLWPRLFPGARGPMEQWSTHRRFHQ